MLQQYLNDRLSVLSDCLEFNQQQTGEIIKLLHNFTDPWIDHYPNDWKSFITDEHYPIEFSLGFEKDKIELRLLLESQTPQSNLINTWNAGLEFNKYLQNEYQISLEKFDLIKDLYYPTNEDIIYALWHGIVLDENFHPKIKLYLKPSANGHGTEIDTIKQTLVRLGYDLNQLLWLDTMTGASFFSIDLNQNLGNRVKIYNKVNNVTVDDLYSSLQDFFSYEEIKDFCYTMSGGIELLDRLPLHISTGLDSTKNVMYKTLHFPIRAYAENDRQAASRIIDYVPDEHKNIYINVVDSYLNGSKNKQTYVSLRNQNNIKRITLYLSP